jgi:hypothetical protein
MDSHPLVGQKVFLPQESDGFGVEFGELPYRAVYSLLRTELRHGL